MPSSSTDLLGMTMRRLEEEDSEPTVYNDGEILRTTLRVYGSIYLVLLVIFCFLRRRYKAYNIRSWAENIHCDLADEQYGWISWMWRLYVLSEDDILDNCGMDALCFLRMLEFGFKVSCVGIFNAIWLMPIYATAPVSEDTEDIDDRIVQVSVSNVPASNPRLIATAVGAWIIFGYTMYLILQELKWFTKKRHLFLSKRMPRNYTVYISGIIPELRSSAALLAFFRESFSYESVLEARVALDIPKLEKKVTKRDKVIAKLEHAIALEEMTGTTPTHLVSIKGEKVNSIEAYTTELMQLNREITEAIEMIEFMNEPQTYRDDLEDAQSRSVVHRSLRSVSGDQTFGSVLRRRLQAVKEERSDNSAMTQSLHSVKEEPNDNSVTRQSLRLVRERDQEPPSLTGDHADISVTSSLTGFADTVESSSIPAGQPTPTQEVTEENAKSDDRNFNRHLSKIGESTLKFGSKLGSTAMAVFNSDDGKPRESGFVTFTKLSTTQAALQMVHHPKPFRMKTTEAPNPDDIFWVNVGKTHEQLQTGKLLGISLTVLLCFFWTIPVAFVSSLSSVDNLKESVPFLERWIEKFPALEQILAQLAPLFLVILNLILPYILIEFAKLEGPVSTSVLEASLFVKLAAFMIIQTFFVASISGSIFESVSGVIDDPQSVVDLLATTLPTQAIFYVQILLVSTFLGQGLELLRVLPLLIAWIRSFVGPNLTEKERNSTWMWMNPLADPWEFEYAEVLAEEVLYFMVTFVYSSLAPITNFFLAFCYLLLGSGYRHQFIYIYPPTPDSGGRLWLGFIGIVQTCMIIAQLTIFGFLGLKRAPVAAGLMVPLMVITVLFNFYIRQEHIRVSDHLPTGDCLEMDLKNNMDGRMDFSFVRGGYLQPAMQIKEALPDNFGIDREVAQENLKFLTPPHSEAEIMDDTDPLILMAEVNSSL